MLLTMRRKVTFEIDDGDEEFLLPAPVKNEDFDTVLIIKLCLFSLLCFLVFCALASWNREVHSFNDSSVGGMGDKFVNNTWTDGSNSSFGGSFVPLPPLRTKTLRHVLER